MAERWAEEGLGISVSAFLGGKLQLFQPAAGHRCGTDAVLLAAAAPRVIEGLAIDAGSGVGAAGLSFAVLRPGIEIGLVENDPATAELARRNISQNGLSGRCRVFEADLLSPEARRSAGLRGESAALVMTNPPYLDPSRARLSPDPSKQKAHVIGGGGLRAWIHASLALAAPGGTLILINRPEALPEILHSLEGRAGGVTLLPIYSRKGKPAARLLVRAVKGSRAPLAIAPPLVLHEGEGFTAFADALHKGTAAIGW
ncbi:MAG TPA: methyltransferase [Methylocella sp.]|nr:methyltransferase [Methylocella sp.]